MASKWARSFGCPAAQPEIEAAGVTRMPMRGKRIAANDLILNSGGGLRERAGGHIAG